MFQTLSSAIVSIVSVTLKFLQDTPYIYIYTIVEIVIAKYQRDSQGNTYVADSYQSFKIPNSSCNFFIRKYWNSTHLVNNNTIIEIAGDPIRWNGRMFEWNGGTAELRNARNILKHGKNRIFWNTEYTKNSKTRNLRNILKRGMRGKSF